MKTTTTSVSSVKNASKNLNPYPNVSGMAHRTFELAKRGTTRNALIASFDAAKIGHARLLRELKHGSFKNIAWSYTESPDGKIRVSDVRELKTKKAAPAKKAEPAAAKKAAPAKKAAKKAEPSTEPAAESAA